MNVYQNANEIIERVCMIFAKALFAYVSFLMLLPALYSSANYYILDAGKESFFLFLPMWFVTRGRILRITNKNDFIFSFVCALFKRCPFDWRTPFRYVVVWMAQCVGAGSLIVGSVPCLNIVFGSTWLFIVIATDITNDLITFNKNAINASKDRDDCSKLAEHLCAIIRSYSDATQWVYLQNFLI